MNAETKPKRKFSKNSTTWQLFNKFFFLETDKYPYTLPPMPRGSAINLVQGLNCCNIQWAEEQSMPLDFLCFSAKAKSTDPLNPKTPDVPWIVEISANQRHGVEGRKRKSSTAWMQALLAEPVEGALPANDTASSPSGEEGVYVPSAVSPHEPEISHMESALESWLGAGRNPEATDDPNAAEGRYPLNTEGEE